MFDPAISRITDLNLKAYAAHQAIACYLRIA